MARAVLFFYQAEDGIRDGHVTGVQTCALPISVTSRGHSFEFRINGENPAANFLPSPGSVSRFKMPSGPGVRVDTGVEDGDVVSGAFDSMLAKLIVTGANREEALQRSRRALAEMDIAGIATVVPFHRAVIREPAFTAENGSFDVHTRWIETEFADRLGTLTAQLPPAPTAEDRKSTRLNSSHVAISYAVFCLKQKSRRQA